MQKHFLRNVTAYKIFLEYLSFNSTRNKSKLFHTSPLLLLLDKKVQTLLCNLQFKYDELCRYIVFTQTA